MHKSTLEQQINEMSDLEELDRIACRYAQGGNKAYALLAWLRAEELGCTKYRKNITAQYFSPELCFESEIDHLVYQLFGLTKEEPAVAVPKGR